jgi:hypothetical protein
MPGQRRGARHSTSAFSSSCTGSACSVGGDGAGSLRSSSRLQTPLFSSQCQPLEQFAQHPPSTALRTPAAATALPANTGAATAEGVLDTVHPSGSQATPHNINQCFGISLWRTQFMSLFQPCRCAGCQWCMPQRGHVPLERPVRCSMVSRLRPGLEIRTKPLRTRRKRALSSPATVLACMR